uniref:Odorant receptor n=1 Tax=Epiphyas postvittana TaxID=65032 RepID=A0A0K8TUV4_EPIPO
MKILRVFLTIPASWPYEVFQGSVHPVYWFYRRCIILWALLAISGEVWFLVTNIKLLSFFEMGHMYLTCFFAILGFVRSLLPLFDKYGYILKSFLMSFHLMHFKHMGGRYQEIYVKIERISYRFVSITMTLAMICAFCFNLIPIVNNVSSGAYRDHNKSIELAVYFSYPHYDPQDHYFFVTGWNMFIVVACSILIAGIDCILLLFILQIIGHIEILRHNLSDFPKPEDVRAVKVDCKGSRKPVFVNVAMFTKEQNLIIKENIKKCVQHHLFIIKFTDNVSQFFGPVMAIYYLFHLVTGCLMLLEMSAGDAASLARYGPVTVVIFGQLVILSMVFETVNTRSEMLVDALYDQAWDSMELSNMRSACLLLHRLQNPIAIQALGVTPINVRTMVMILKTSFSYFAFLKTLDV